MIEFWEKQMMIIFSEICLQHHLTRRHENNMEQRANVQFCLKLDKTFTETLELIRQVYGDDCRSRT